MITQPAPGVCQNCSATHNEIDDETGLCPSCLALRPTATTAENVAEYEAAVVLKADRWVVAACGTETPFESDGRRWLYVYNPGRQERGLRGHGYLDLETDIVYDSYGPNRSVVGSS